MNNFPGKFIVLYGINNLGKSTQAKKLVERLNSYGQKTEYLKYPIYDLHPSGKVLNNYLRGGNIFELTAREAQLIYTLNRTQYQNELIKKLQNGINIIAEDYTGTGLAWGIGAGVDEHFLKGINSHLLKEDLAFLFDGERFLSGLENGHKHETNNELTEKVRKIHWRLAEELSWVKINANLSIDEIHKVLWKYITTIIHNDNFKEKLINREKLEKLTAERITDTAKLPSKSYNHDAGFDLYANEYYSLLPGQRTAIKTGVKMAIPQNYVGLIWDKSGIANNGIKTMGGVIDSGYRGEIKVVLINLSEDIYHIAPGQKIAQILIQEVKHLEICEEKISDETERGLGGFGSSGLF